MAAEAGVTTLVLNHVLPGSLMDLPDEIYFEGIRESFQGEIIVGTDRYGDLVQFYRGSTR